MKKKGKRDFREICLAAAESIRHRFASYDTLMQLTPFSVINIIRWLLVSVLAYGFYCGVHGIGVVYFFSKSTYLGQLLHFLFPFKITAESGAGVIFIGMLLQIWLRLLYRLGMYIENMWAAVYLFIVEHKRIKKMPIYKKALYTLTWPTFDIIGRYTQYVALFKKVDWKPIPHESKVTIDDLNANPESKEEKSGATVAGE